ncbi:MAG: tetratricopeptide repeat protein [bacterium]
MSDQFDIKKILERGFQAHQGGDLELAEQLYKDVLNKQADQVDALQLLANIYHQMQQYKLAIAYLKKAINLQNDVAEFHFNLGVSYQQLGEHSSAQKAYQRALDLHPDYVDALNNLATMLQDSGDIESAISLLKRVIKINPQLDYSFYNLASCYRMNGNHKIAESYCDQALDLNPTYVDARLMKAGFLLSSRQFKSGWQEYEWRHYQLEPNTPYRAPLPVWAGQSGVNLLIVAEQGLGDEIMFAACINDLMSRCESIVLLCDSRLVPLFSRSFPQCEVIATPQAGDHRWLINFPLLEMCISMGSLPAYTKKSQADFAQSKPYLNASKQRKDHWRNKLAALPKGKNIGISWRGGKDEIEQSLRSVPLRMWTEIFSQQKINFINLQYSDHADEINQFEQTTDFSLQQFPEINPLKELEEYAALISNLDLVISIDNSSVHLAAALGVETWVILPKGANWRWGNEGENSLWYPTVRLFRQAPDQNDFAICILDISAALKKHVKATIRTDTPLNQCEIDTLKSKLLKQASKEALLINDTSHWYHWGCSCTSLTIHRKLRSSGFGVSSIPVYELYDLQGLPSSIAELDDVDKYHDFKQQNREIISAINRSHVIIINGEGTLHGLTPAALGILYIAYISAHFLNKPVHIINHSCYPDDSLEIKNNMYYSLYQKVYLALSSIAIRELYSAKLIAQLGLNVTIGFDCMPLFIQQHNPHCKKDAEQIVIAGSVSWNRDMINNIAELILWFSSQGYQVKILIGAAAFLSNDDQEFVKLISQQCKGHYQLLNATSENEWLREIGTASLLISGRFHHSIAAACLRTPLIMMESNTPKNNAIADMLNIKTMLPFKHDAMFDSIKKMVADTMNKSSLGLVEGDTIAYLRELSQQNFKFLG